MAAPVLYGRAENLIKYPPVYRTSLAQYIGGQVNTQGAVVPDGFVGRIGRNYVALGSASGRFTPGIRPRLPS